MPTTTRSRATASFAVSPEAVTVRLHSLSAANGDAQGDTFPYTVDVAYTDAGGLEQAESLPDVEHLIGSAHDDILAGDRRDNDLAGGPGDDRLAGGLGADVFVFGPGDGADTVTDFSAGTDKLDLTAFEIEDFEDVTITMTSGADGVTVDLSDIDGGSILPAGLTTLPEGGDFLV